jgi:hypothetical protein
VQNLHAGSILSCLLLFGSYRMEIEAQESALEETERALQAATSRAAEAEAKAAAAVKELEVRIALLLRLQ